LQTPHASVEEIVGWLTDVGWLTVVGWLDRCRLTGLQVAGPEGPSVA
jgi:hypothetical protein